MKKGKETVILILISQSCTLIGEFYCLMPNPENGLIIQQKYIAIPRAGHKIFIPAASLVRQSLY
ncbi:MAG: hypothetical protein KAT15_01505, partial [Bacteroidales bacterium]|nr:hypothetical protein [Bacteroidales bacterium]